MPVVIDFTIGQGEDANITIAMAPPQAIGGWSIAFDTYLRFGGSSGLIHKTCASGFNGVSGITVLNSGVGIFRVAIRAADISGWESRNYAYQATRTNSGSVSILTQGFLSLLPGV